MSYTYSASLADRSNYGARRDTSLIKYIVIHYTGNDGDTGGANANYFKGANRGASAHYFVDDTSVVQSVPDDYAAWHCGGDYYYCECRNTTSIGVEMCDTVSNGIHDLSAATRENAIQLVRSLMAKYSVPIERVIRHYDVTRKKCPAYFVDNAAAWAAFKNELIYDTKTGGNDMTLEEIMNISGTGDNPSSWAKEATNYCKTNHFFSGDNGDFGWQKPISREAAALITKKLDGGKYSGGDCSDWAAAATQYCIEKGIFSGDGSGNYDWGAPMTREAFAVVLLKVLEKLGVKDRL